MGKKTRRDIEKTSTPTLDQRASEERFDRLTELSPSAKFVHKVLRDDGRLTQGEITEQTLLPIRTVRYALGKLEQADLVEKQSAVHDARTNYYSPKSITRTDSD